MNNLNQNFLGEISSPQNPQSYLESSYIDDETVEYARQRLQRMRSTKVPHKQELSKRSQRLSKSYDYLEQNFSKFKF